MLVTCQFFVVLSSYCVVLASFFIARSAFGVALPYSSVVLASCFVVLSSPFSTLLSNVFAFIGGVVVQVSVVDCRCPTLPATSCVGTGHFSRRRSPFKLHGTGDETRTGPQGEAKRGEVVRSWEK